MGVRAPSLDREGVLSYAPRVGWRTRGPTDLKGGVMPMLEELRTAIAEAENLGWHHQPNGTLERDHYDLLVDKEERLATSTPKYTRAKDRTRRDPLV